MSSGVGGSLTEDKGKIFHLHDILRTEILQWCEKFSHTFYLERERERKIYNIFAMIFTIIFDSMYYIFAITRDVLQVL